MKSGILFCFAGPSGSGKTTLSDLFRDKSEGSISRITTVTTRKPRDGEVSGVDYHFWSSEQFLAGVENNLFFEHEVVHGMHYGTLKKSLQDAVAGRGVSSIILDVNGAIKLKESSPADVVNVFLTCTHKQELYQRILKRNTTPDDLERRLNAASVEIATYTENVDKFDYLIVNDDLQASWTVLSNIMIHERVKRGDRLHFKD